MVLLLLQWYARQRRGGTIKWHVCAKPMVSIKIVLGFLKSTIKFAMLLDESET